MSIGSANGWDGCVVATHFSSHESNYISNLPCGNSLVLHGKQLLKTKGLL